VTGGDRHLVSSGPTIGARHPSR